MFLTPERYYGHPWGAFLGTGHDMLVTISLRQFKRKKDLYI